MLQLRKEVVCLVESGWEGIRRLTISLANEKVPCTCIIKGKLREEILDIITKYNGISLRSITRNIFKLYILAIFLRSFLLRNTICVVMDNRKNYCWVSAINRLLGIRTILLVEGKYDYLLFLDKKQQDIKCILNLAKTQR